MRLAVCIIIKMLYVFYNLENKARPVRVWNCLCWNVFGNPLIKRFISCRKKAHLWKRLDFYPPHQPLHAQQYDGHEYFIARSRELYLKEMGDNCFSAVAPRYSLLQLKLQEATKSACLEICLVFLKVIQINSYHFIYEEYKLVYLPLSFVTISMAKTTLE